MSNPTAAVLSQRDRVASILRKYVDLPTIESDEVILAQDRIGNVERTIALSLHPGATAFSIIYGSDDNPLACIAITLTSKSTLIGFLQSPVNETVERDLRLLLSREPELTDFFERLEMSWILQERRTLLLINKIAQRALAPL